MNFKYHSLLGIFEEKNYEKTLHKLRIFLKFYLIYFYIFYTFTIIVIYKKKLNCHWLGIHIKCYCVSMTTYSLQPIHSKILEKFWPIKTLEKIKSNIRSKLCIFAEVIKHIYDKYGIYLYIWQKYFRNSLV